MRRFELPPMSATPQCSTVNAVKAVVGASRSVYFCTADGTFFIPLVHHIWQVSSH